MIEVDVHDLLGGGNSNIFGIFTPQVWEGERIFFKGVVQPPTSLYISTHGVTSFKRLDLCQPVVESGT